MGQQFTLAAVPQGDAFAHAPIQLAKVVFHFAKVGQQFTRTLHELLEAVFERGVVEQRHIADLNARHFGIDTVTLLLQVGHAFGGVGLAALADLLEQVKQREQARFGTHELAFRQLC